MHSSARTNRSSSGSARRLKPLLFSYSVSRRNVLGRGSATLFSNPLAERIGAARGSLLLKTARHCLLGGGPSSALWNVFFTPCQTSSSRLPSYVPRREHHPNLSDACPSTPPQNRTPPLNLEKGLQCRSGLPALQFRLDLARQVSHPFDGSPKPRRGDTRIQTRMSFSSKR
jgi:hypothetical protein